MNKKGNFYLGFLATFFVFTLLLTVYINVQGKINSLEKPIGERQGLVLQAATEADEIMLYLDQSIKYGASTALASVAESGANNAKCGTYFDYALWNKKGADCKPNLEEIYNQITFSLESSLNEYLTKFNDESKTEVPVDNYYFTYNPKEKSMLGIAKDLLIIQLIDSSGRNSGNYTLDPSVQVTFNSDFLDEYEYVTNTVFDPTTGLLQKVKECQSNTLGTLPETCTEVEFIELNSKRPDLKWSTNCDSSPDPTDSMIKICVETQNNYYDPTSKNILPVVIKFALDFSDI